MNKKKLREEMFDILRKIPESEKADRSRRMLDFLSADSILENAENIMCFVSFRNEISTHALIRMILERKKNVYVPVIKNREMLISRIESFEELKPGFYGIPEPEEASFRITMPEVLDMVITPGVVFDKKGFRIGYGGGYYDRLFSSAGFSAEKTAVCFTEQIRDEIEKEPHDIAVDRVLGF